MADDLQRQINELKQQVSEIRDREDIVVSPTGSSLGGRVKGRGLQVKLSGRETIFDFSKSVRFAKPGDYVVEHASTEKGAPAFYTMEPISGTQIKIVSSTLNDSNLLNIKITGVPKPGR